MEESLTWACGELTSLGVPHVYVKLAYQNVVGCGNQ